MTRTGKKLLGLVMSLEWNTERTGTIAENENRFRLELGMRKGLIINPELRMRPQNESYWKWD